jgi:hypothetical protein
MRRAEDRDILVGASGGKRDWKVFIISGRCGGVSGEFSGGKDASTSYIIISDVNASVLNPEEDKHKPVGGTSIPCRHF